MYTSIVGGCVLVKECGGSVVVTVAKHDAKVKARVPSALRDAVQASPTSISDAIRNGLKLAANGEEVAEAEEKNEVASEQCSQWREDIETALSDLHREHGEALSFDAVHDTFETLCRERGDAVAAANAERSQRAQSQLAARDADPEAASLGADMSPVEAAEAMLDESGTLPPRYIREGPENVGVQNFAEKCGEEPAEFWEIAQEELPDKAFESTGLRSSGVATAGGGSS